MANTDTDRPLLASMSGGIRASRKRKLKRASRSAGRAIETATYDSVEERVLENIVFGESGDVLSRFDSDTDLITIDTTSSGKSTAQDRQQLFLVDTVGDRDLHAAVTESEPQEEEDEDILDCNRQDSDDDDQQLQQQQLMKMKNRLQLQFSIQPYHHLHFHHINSPLYSGISLLCSNNCHILAQRR